MLSNPTDADASHSTYSRADDAGFETLVADLRGRFDVIEAVVPIAGRDLTMLKPRSADDLLDEEAFNRDERIPYWAEIWPCSLVLAERLAATAGSGQSLLELGSGVGLVSNAALMGGFDVVCTDYYAESLEFCRVNAWRNQLPAPRVRDIDWRQLPTDLGTFDWVVGSEVLYERPYAVLVAEAIRVLLAPGGTALITDPGRPWLEHFVGQCQDRGLTANCVARIPAESNSAKHTVQVWELRKPGP